MSSLSNIILRHREPGYLRFSLPPEWLSPERAESLELALTAQEGIYSVRIYLSQGKIAIRYLSVVLEESLVLKQLSTALKKLLAPAKNVAKAPSKHMVTTSATAHLPVRSKGSTSLAVWLQNKLTELKETLQAMQILGSRALKSMGASFSLRPRWAREFMNDLLMLFLIKLHWEHLVYEWLPRPWAHRYEWAATFYLIYLSVQSKTAMVA
jgi:hypothetical protein